MIKPEDQPTFIFEAFGTRGDIAPLLGLAEQRGRRGHACQVIAPSFLRATLRRLERSFERTRRGI